jgi:serine/threonine-protein kinase
VLIVAGAVVALALGTYGWSLANPPSDKQAAQGPVVVPPSGKCVVSYAVWTDANGRFKAEVTVANRADTAVTDWKLWFIMPGDQVVRGDGKMQLTQDKHTVTVSSKVDLKPQKTLTLPISGRYVKNNAVPQAFELNKQTCETYVSSKPGEPSKKVEHLSDGKTRLAPTPATSAPGGGIQIGPGGVVKITPTTAPTTGPTTGPTTVKTDEPTTGPTTDRPEPSAPPTKGTTAPTTAPTTSATPPPSGVTNEDKPCVVTEDEDCLTTGE